MVYHLLADGRDADGRDALDQALLMPITSEGRARYDTAMTYLQGVLDG